MKTITKKPTKKLPKTSSNSSKKRGNLSPQEIQPLIMAAREAYNVQSPGISFDEWRSEQVQECVGLPGLTSCDHAHFCNLMAHFKIAGNREDEALAWLLKADKNTSRQIAWSISQILTAHLTLAHSSPADLAASTSPRRLPKVIAARDAILHHEAGPISFDYLLAIVRDKTRRPDLTLTTDLPTSLADRCDPAQLAHIRFTLANRIAEREGRGNTTDRNRSQNSAAAKAGRSPDTVAPRF